MDKGGAERLAYRCDCGERICNPGKVCPECKGVVEVIYGIARDKDTNTMSSEHRRYKCRCGYEGTIHEHFTLTGMKAMCACPKCLEDVFPAMLLTEGDTMSEGHQPKCGPTPKPPEGWSPNPSGSGIASLESTGSERVYYCEVCLHLHGSIVSMVEGPTADGDYRLHCPQCGKEWKVNRGYVRHAVSMKLQHYRDLAHRLGILGVEEADPPLVDLSATVGDCECCGEDKPLVRGLCHSCTRTYFEDSERELAEEKRLHQGDHEILAIITGVPKAYLWSNRQAMTWKESKEKQLRDAGEAATASGDKLKAWLEDDPSKETP